MENALEIKPSSCLPKLGEPLQESLPHLWEDPDFPHMRLLNSEDFKKEQNELTQCPFHRLPQQKVTVQETGQKG